MNKWKELLKNKTIDCIWCGFSIDGRTKQYQWTIPYLRCEQKVVVRADSGIKHLSDLKGKNVAVQVDTKTEEYFLKQQSSGKLRVGQISTYKNLMEAVAVFNKGYADAVAELSDTLQDMIQDGTIKKIVSRYGIDSGQLVEGKTTRFGRDYSDVAGDDYICKRSMPEI